ncbi:hypothetical protein RIF23_19345 [Lipingzhangella sp. LS1_29]|uniref:Uncharacterized protein n=1 Tax=Lipingzhangella rawalii TaxID=2055835 RepID=A0ABU2HBS6_9ACTN|nr:hypothetical protein [Lipingzhangella rawalii]MDS1272447.1 hypothetical protein [Lipingzhangella rawalii]
MRRATWPVRRRVVAVVHHLTAGTRLADEVLPLVETNPHVEVTFTVPPASDFAGSGTRFVRELDGAYLPWDEATRTHFDLAVAANYGGLEQLRAPALVLNHGVGPGSRDARRPGHGPAVSRPVRGAVPNQLVHRGRVVPAAIGVANERLRELIRREVPEAAQVTHVVGDHCHDRIQASTALRDAYRAALGVGDGQRLVVVSSRWGPRSLLGRHPELPQRLVRELPAGRYRVVVVPHPVAWFWHGRRQVRAWFAPAQRDGLMVLPPEWGWQAALVASDLVVGDLGSVTCYAAAATRPVLLGACPRGDVSPRSAMSQLARQFPRLRYDEELAPQLASAQLEHDPRDGDRVARRLTSAPGRAAPLLRSLMYRMLRLEEPQSPAVIAPADLPRPLPVLGSPDSPEDGRWAA